ncbi:MAG: hypothetical protein U0M12_02400 [Acutalibacteraceae bacterium]|nr:hypothetical protein [Acutalibacteraceae bacterium]
MTNDEWKEVEEKLLLFGELVKLEADGYKLTLFTVREKMKLYIVVYINGKFKFEWIESDCEIRRKFMSSSKHCVIKQKELDKITKRKERQKELKKKYTYTTYSPYWSSFSRLKKHLIKNNERIEILLEEK